MILFRKIPKTGYGGIICLPNGELSALSNSFNNKQRSSQSKSYIFYRYIGVSLHSANEVTDLSFSSLFEDDWMLLGLLPSKKAKNYGNSEKHFFLSFPLAENLKQDVISYAKERMLSYLALRERSESECKNYLNNLPVNDEFSQQIIHDFLKMNYINDQRFAELSAESSVSRNKSYFEAKNLLIKKNIDPEIIEKVLSNIYTLDNSKKVLDYHLRKALKKYPDRNSYKDYHKCLSYLINKGFRYDTFAEQVKLEFHIS